MNTPSWSFVSGLVLSAAVIGAVLLPPAADAKRKPPPPPPPPPPASSTFVRSYADVLNGVESDVTPETVQSTSDGGSVALALADPGVSWLVKLGPSGSPQWQEEVGCFDLPPGSFADGVSLQQTGGGGYVIAGGTIGCGSSTICPFLSGIQCGLVERLDANGRVIWARVYSTGATWTAINRIRQTSDGGFVAVGSAQGSDSIGALILKLDGQGNLQWQRQLGPAGSTSAYLNDVQQTGDGGFVATGELDTPSESLPRTGVLVVELDANGAVRWVHGFNRLDESGAPTAANHALSIIQTSEGGYLVAGNWDNTTSPGTCCRGALLLKLDANGNSQWQKAYSGGVYCFFNGYSETCSALGGIVYSVHQTADGGYILAGDGDLKLRDSTPLVPWLAKVDASGNLVWQHFYYEAHPTTGRPLSEYFASSTLTDGGGVLALGFTENPTNLRGELFAVRTDSSGLAGACGQVRPAESLDAVDPGLVPITVALPAQTTLAVQDASPGTTRPTSIGGTGGQC
jgi:hypothetical protein